MNALLRFWTDWFILWVAVFSLLAYLFPPPFAALHPLIVPGLGVIMFGMGMTLTPADFLRVARMKRAVACGMAGQFTVMPILALVLSRAFGLGPELSVGFVILGCCPGGTASNVIAYLARADVALSVTMTACSTLAAIVLTPLLSKLLAQTYLAVDAWAMFLSVVKIVLIPVAGGLTLRRLLGARAQLMLDLFPAVSVLVIVLIIACIVALTGDRLAGVLGTAGVVVLVHNTLGLASGYGLAALFGLSRSARKTVAIEVGMQNSGLGVSLAAAHFAAQPLVALPSSLFSVVHNLTGSALAWWWRRARGLDSGVD